MKMYHFESLGKNKSEFIQQILNRDNLVKCLYNNQKNFLDYSVDNKSDLVMNNIYPCKYIPGTNESAKSFVCMEFAYEPSRSSVKVYQTSIITFYIFSHISLIQTDYNILRYDYALQEIDSIMNGLKSDQWLGEMEFGGANDIILDPQGNYVGTSVTYRGIEFR